MIMPPPTVPGTPPRNSTPPRFSRVANDSTLPVEAPASSHSVGAVVVAALDAHVAQLLERDGARRACRRRAPAGSSRSRRRGCGCRAPRRWRAGARSAASEPGAAQASTGPPMRSVVWRAIGSSKRSLAVAARAPRVERLVERLLARRRTRLQRISSPTIQTSPAPSVITMSPSRSCGAERRRRRRRACAHVRGAAGGPTRASPRRAAPTITPAIGSSPAA